MGPARPGPAGFENLKPSRRTASGVNPGDLEATIGLRWREMKSREEGDPGPGYGEYERRIG